MINCVTINFWALLVLMMIVTKVSRLILSFSPVECRKTDIIAPVVCHKFGKFGDDIFDKEF